MEKTNKAYAILMGLPEVQRLNLRLMELASFNSFDGPKVVQSLLNNKDLWQACLMDREAYGRISLIKLRDMADETVQRLGKQIWSVDTLFIVPQADTRIQVRLLRLAETWEADEVDWILWPEAGNLLGGSIGDKLPILRVWWD